MQDIDRICEWITRLGTVSFRLKGSREASGGESCSPHRKTAKTIDFRINESSITP